MVPILSQALCGFWVEMDCSRPWHRGIIIDQVPQAWPQLLPGPMFHHHYAWGPVTAAGDTSRIWLWKWELEEGAGPRSYPPAPRSERGFASCLLQAVPEASVGRSTSFQSQHWSPSSWVLCSVALTLCCPRNCSSPVSSVHGIHQTSILEWVVICFSRGSCQPKD